MPIARRATPLLNSRLPVRVVSRQTAARLLAVNVTVPSTKPRHAEIPAATRHEPDGVALVLPVPPSVNHQYATVRGRRLLSAAGRAYKAQVGNLVLLALAKSSHRAALLSRLQSNALVLSIRFYFTSPLRRDVDGGLKIAQDALCEGLGVNDNRIVETHLYKHVDKFNPRIEVSLTAAPTGGSLHPSKPTVADYS